MLLYYTILGRQGDSELATSMPNTLCVFASILICAAYG